MDRKSVGIVVAFLFLLTLRSVMADVSISHGSNTFTLTGELSFNLTSTLTATFVDANGNIISRTTITNTRTSLTAPIGAVYMILQGEAVSIERLIYLPVLSSGDIIAFPFSSSVTTRTATVLIFNKDAYDVLVVETSGGAVVAAYDLSDFTDISFPGIVGSIYVFKLIKDGQVVYTQTAGIADSTDYIMIIPPEGPIEFNISTISVTITASYAHEYRRIRGYINVTGNITGSVKVELYTPDGTYLTTLGPTNFTNVANTDFTFYVPSDIDIPFTAKILVETDHGIYTRTITCTSGRLLPDNVAPNGLMLSLLGALSLFALNRTNIEISVALMAVILTVGQMLRLVTVPDSMMFLTYAMASSLFIFGRLKR